MTIFAALRESSVLARGLQDVLGEGRGALQRGARTAADPVPSSGVVDVEAPLLSDEPELEELEAYLLVLLLL